MTILQKQFAVLTAAVLLLNGSASSVPVPADAARRGSVSAFAEQLLSGAHTLPELPFAQLSYDCGSGQLLRDGAPTDGSFAGFSAENGTLTVEKAAVLTSAELAAGADASGTVSLAEAAEKIGCTYITENGQTLVSSPFQSGTLIVRAPGAFDLRGGTDTASGADGLHVLQYPTAADAYRAYSAFCADERISFAEPEIIYHVCDTDDDMLLSEELAAGEWGYDAVGCDAFMHRLDDEQNEANPLCVAVLDTGITADHSWFQDRIASGGCSFVPEVVTNADDHGHGTFCAGIISRCTRDNVKILPLKVLDRTGYGTSVQVYCGMLYAAELGAEVINMSLSGMGQSLLLEDGVKQLRSQGITCIAAAGNEKWDVMYDNPANISDVIAVASVTQLNSTDPAMPPTLRYDLSAFSNSGKGIGFSAPGDHIASANYRSKDGLQTDSGTSMAAPFVTACYADLLDYDPLLTPEQIISALEYNAVDLGERGFDPKFGCGMVCMKDFVLTESFCDRPEASVRSGHFTAVTPVTLSCFTSDADICYTTDGSMPDRTNGIRYDGTPLMIDRTMTLKAIAYTDISVSSVMVCDYCIDCPVPEVSVRPGAYDDAVTISLRSAVPSDIYYTLDGTVPNPETSMLYTGEPIRIDETTLVGAVTVIGEMQSAPMWAAYEIGGLHQERLLRFEGTQLAGCYLNGSSLDIEALAGTHSITEIAPRVFAEISGLTAVTLPDTVTVLGDAAFENCTDLVQVTANGAETLGRAVFSGCTALSSVKLGAVTEIPAEGFRNCRALRTLGFDLRTVSSVGAYAFAGSGCSEPFDLPALAALGTGAFSDMERLDLTLPSRITRLPDALCRNTETLSLTAPGVTEIGVYALAAGSGDREILRLDIPFEKLTAVGENGFAFADLNRVSGGQIIFSALTAADKGAFRYVSCRGMAFPQLKTVLSDTFTAIRTEVLRLDTAALICQEAISPKQAESCCLIFGSDHTEIDENALGDPLQYAVIAAPSVSDAGKFCRKYSYPFRETPDLFLPEDKPGMLTGEHTLLTAVPLGIGLQAAWQQDAEASPPAENTDMLFADLDPFAVTGELSSWKAVLWENGILLKTREISAVRSDFIKYTEIPQTDEPVLVVWNELMPQSELDRLAGRPVSAKFTFTAAHEGDYICYAVNPAGTLTVTPASSEEFTQKGSGAEPEKLLYVHLQAGETVTMTLRDLGSYAVNAVMVTETFPKQTLADAVIEPERVLRDHQPDAPPPAVTVKHRGTVLQEDTDYKVICRFADRPGLTEIYAVGIGMYAGILYVGVWDAEPFTEGTPVTLSEQGNSTRLFRLIPEQSGQYVVSLMPGEPDRLPALYSGERLQTDLLLWDQDLNLIDTENTLGITAQYLCQFTAGQPVYLMLYLRENAGRSYQLSAEPLGDRMFLGSAAFREPDAAFTDPLPDSPPEVICYPPDADPNAAEPVVLTEGTDYEWIRCDALLPGGVRWVLTGKGRCAGFACLTENLHYDFGSAAEIRTDEPFTVSGNCGVFRYVQQGSEPVPDLIAEDGSEFEYAYYFAPDEICGIPYQQAVKRANYREVCIAVRSADGRPHSYRLQGEKKRILLADAEAEPVTAVYTGQTQRPSFRVTYQGRELQEGVDYAIRLNYACRECGEYYPLLTGLGDFTGSLSTSYTIVMPEPEQLTPVPAGRMDAVIRVPGAAELYSFVPESRSCCLMKTSFPDAAVRLLDSRGMTVGRASGIGTRSSVIAVQPGVTYYVAVSLTAPQETGAVRFEVREGVIAISTCRITGEKLLQWDPVSAKLPAVRIFDGNTELVQGFDYTLLTSDTPLQFGYNILYIRGVGHYTGEVLYEYYVAPPADVLTSDDRVIMTLEQDVPLKPGAPGSCRMLSFTAPEDGTYYLDMSKYDKYCCTLLRYSDNGKAVSAGRLCFPMKAGETVWFFSLMNWPEADVDPNPDASVRMTTKMPVVSFEQNGYGFLTETDGTFSVMSLPPDQCGYILPETVTDPETGITAQLYEIFGKLTWHNYDYFVGTVTIYGTPGGAVEAFCDENGYCFSDIDPDCSVRGDLTGDGLVNADDSQTLSRWLAEGGGMMLPGQAAEAADLNGDGKITLADLYEILRIAKE